jgi:hypothetical protein
VSTASPARRMRLSPSSSPRSHPSSSSLSGGEGRARQTSPHFRGRSCFCGVGMEPGIASAKSGSTSSLSGAPGSAGRRSCCFILTAGQHCRIRQHVRPSCSLWGRVLFVCSSRELSVHDGRCLPAFALGVPQLVW